MAKKEIVQQILKTFKQLGGNISEVLGTRTNISFLGKGDNVEPFLDRNLNTEALGVLSQSKAIDEAKNAVGFAVSDKLNDIQANNLLVNLNKMKEFYMPPAAPANIVDLGTRTGNLDVKGLASLRRMTDDVDLPPPGSRGEPEDIAAPFQDAETTIKNLEAQEAGLGKQFKNIITNKGDVPGKRASAREFLVEALKKDETDVGTAAFGKANLNNIISVEDVKYITEGGGGLAGDPILIVEKYFGPRILEMIPTGATGEDIITFTRGVMDNVEDAAGLKPDNPKFDRFTARFVDETQNFAKGGLAKILEV